MHDNAHVDNTANGQSTDADRSDRTTRRTFLNSMASTGAAAGGLATGIGSAAAAGKPDPPAQFNYEYTMTNTVELAWDPSPTDIENPRYKAYVDGEQTDWGIGSKWLLKTDGAIRDLDGGTRYKIGVTVLDADGNESEPLTTTAVTRSEYSIDRPPVPEDTYTIENVNSGKLLDVSQAGTDNGDNVIQWEDNGGDNQQWAVEEVEYGVLRIENVNSGKVLDVKDMGTENGDNVVQWEQNGGDNQHWKIPTEDPTKDTYRLKNVNSGKMLDVEAQGTDNGDNVIQWENNGGDNQRWTFHEV